MNQRQITKSEIAGTLIEKTRPVTRPNPTWFLTLLSDRWGCHLAATSTPTHTHPPETLLPRRRPSSSPISLCAPAQAATTPVPPNREHAHRHDRPSALSLPK